MEPRQLRGAHGRRALVVDEVDDALPEDGVLLDHLRQVVAHFQALESVQCRQLLRLGSGVAGAHLVEEVGEVVEELREVVEQYRPVQVPGGRQSAHSRQPVGEDPVPVRAEKVR